MYVPFALAAPLISPSPGSVPKPWSMDEACILVQYPFFLARIPKLSVATLLPLLTLTSTFENFQPANMTGNNPPTAPLYSKFRLRPVPASAYSPGVAAARAVPPSSSSAPPRSSLQVPVINFSSTRTNHGGGAGGTKGPGEQTHHYRQSTSKTTTRRASPLWPAPRQSKRARTEREVAEPDVEPSEAALCVSEVQDDLAGMPVPYAWRAAAEQRQRVEPGEPGQTQLRADSGPQAGDTRSAKFWYSDGSVVVRVERTLFRYFRTVLEEKCGYFKALFNQSPGRSGSSGIDVDRDDAAGETETKPEISEGCVVYTVGVCTVTAEEFERFLLALSTPLVESSALSEEEIISLLRTSHALQCATIYSPAKARLVALWPPYPAPLTRQHPPRKGVEMLALARTCGVPEIAKLAAYQIVGSVTFWTGLPNKEKRACLEGWLSEQDIWALWAAKSWLQKEWRTLVVIPPNTRRRTVTVGAPGHGHGHGPREETVNVSECLSRAVGAPEHEWCYKLKDQQRVAWWYLAWKDEIEKGDGDPIGALTLLRDKWQELSGRWCQRCLQERGDLWNAARTWWWAALDDKMKLEL
ncbi:hypothetical protein C8Q80DRAFT_1266866 [Daedaleopsis nitida]|nr:hypothetical protein C8Q80DRAFT_1266866 [Daedaleopsis nitida]